MASEFLLSEYADEAALQKQTALILSSFDQIEAKAKQVSLTIQGSLSGMNGKSISSKAALDDLQKLDNATRAYTASAKAVVPELQKISIQQKQAALDLIELKKWNVELAIQAKEKAAADKVAAQAAKDRSADEKQAAADNFLAGKEKIKLLKEEQEQLEKTEQAARDRNNAEAANLEGNYNPGGGKGNAPTPLPNLPLSDIAKSSNVLLLKAYENEIIKLAAETKAAKIAFDSNAISQNAYKEIVVRNTEKTLLLKKSVADLSTEMKLQLNVSETERNSLGRANALIAQYTNAKKTLNLATAEGRLLNDNYNKAIQNTNAFILKNADAETIRTKTVGKYENAILSAGSKAFSFLRTAAAIIPGLGLSGIFLLIYEGIKYATEALGLFNSKLSEAAQNKRDLAAIGTDAGDIASGDIARLDLLKSKITDLNLPLAERLKLVKEYNLLASDGNKIDEKQIESTGYLNSVIDRQIKLIEKRAIAKAFENKITEAESKKLDAEFKVRGTNYGKEIDDLERLEDARLSATMQSIKGKKLRFLTDKELAESPIDSTSLAEYDKDVQISEKKRFASRQVKLSDEYKAYLAEKENVERLLKLSKDYIDTDSLSTDKKSKISGGSKDKQIQALKDRQNAAFDLYKIAQEAKLRADELDLKNDRVYYLNKLSILDGFVRKSKELIERQEQNDIEVKQREAAREIQRLNEEKTGKNGKQISRINENIKIVQANLEQDILKIKAKAADDGVKLIENAAVIRQKLVDDHLKSEAELYAEYAKVDQDLLDKTNERFKKALEKRLKHEEEYKKKSAELAKELTQQKIDLGLKAEGVLYSLATATFQNQLNLNRHQQDAVSQKQQEELKANDALVQSAEDKANNIIIINARAQAQKDILDKKNRDIETQKAKFERAQQIFEIGISTIKSLALIKANAVALSVNPLYGPVFGKILAAQAMAQIPLLLATSALSVGALLAQPLPKYFKGRSKDDPYTGFATVNEIRREVIERKDGSIEYPTGKNVMTFLEKGDAVHPFGEEFMNSLKGSAMRDAGRVATKGGGVSINFSTRTMEGKLDKQNSLLQQIADRPIETTYGTEGSLKTFLRWGMKQIDYTDKTTNW